MSSSIRERFESNPAGFLEDSIKEYVASSPGNRLRAFGGTPIFEEPLVGFADGDDPIFTQYKSIIGDFHLTPREALTRHFAETGGKDSGELPSISVVSWVLPVARGTRLSNSRETRGPSLRWNHTRWDGQDFNLELARHMVALLEKLGYNAVAPEASPLYVIQRQPGGLASNWSQRHIAYVAGLGTFSLSDGFITPKGIAMRCGSLVTDARLPASPRPYPNHLANCLFYVNGSCRKCIERCPEGAITEQGHDKDKCRYVLFEVQRPWMEGVYGEGYIGDYPGCGLCQTGVPCEDRIPVP
jgi:ferredoxin